MRLDAVILNWNQAGDTIACVRSLSANLEPDDTVWVVDNHSRGDDPARIGAACPEARVLASDRNLGFGGGNNLALREILTGVSSTRVANQVLLLNNDARIDRLNLEALRRSLAENPRLAALGPLLFDGNRPDLLLSAGGRDIARHVATHETVFRPPPRGRDEDTPETPLEVDYVPGTCILMATDALRHVGLLDEEYFFAGEVADYCHRARSMDRPSAVLGSTRALHYTSRASARRGELYGYYVLRNRFLYARRHHPRERHRLALEWTYRGLRFSFEALARGDRRRARALRLAVADGWLGRFGDRNRAVLGDRTP